MTRKKHDYFFRAAFKERRLLLEAMNLFLPDHVKELALMSQFQVVSETFISEELRENMGDVLLAIPLKGGGTAYLYILFEHQSKIRTMMPVRLKKLEGFIQDQHLKTKGTGKLPLVVKQGIYNGPKPWRDSTCFFDYFEVAPELAKQVHCEPFQLRDLGGVSDEEIKETTWLGLMELLAKHAYDPDISPQLEKIAQALERLEEDASGTLFLETAIRYLLEVAETQKTPDVVKNTVKYLKSPRAKEPVMTVADFLREEGRQEGWKEGRQEGQEEAIQAIVTNMLSKGLEINEIADLTGVSQQDLLKHKYA